MNIDPKFRDLTLLFQPIIIFVLLSTFSFGCKEKTTPEPGNIEVAEEQPLKEEPQIAIVPISHASAVLTWDGITIYVDPVGGADKYKDFKNPDLIIITDIHGDHFNLETLQNLSTERAKIVLPDAVAQKMPADFTPQLDVLNNGDTKERYGILIKAIPMYNLREEALQFHTKGRGNGYVLEKDGERIYFSGDTEDIPEMRALENIDMAFICMNLPYTMTVESAASAVIEFKPRTVYPYHYRGKPDIGDVEKFKSIVNKADPEIKVVLLDWYPEAPY